MNNPLRTFLFTHYWWITAAAVAAVAVTGRPEALAANPAALLAGALGVVYFVQKQKLDELQLFERLFRCFNERYEAMNERLRRAIADPATDEAEFRNALDDYFNLCAEEYLFFSEGRVLPRVWRAWCRGMMVYLANGRVRQYWDAEAMTGSYYGLTFGIIQEGALSPD